MAYLSGRRLKGKYRLVTPEYLVCCGIFPQQIFVLQRNKTHGIFAAALPDQIENPG
ncbi:hypothetical protein [Bradyrhizobium cosmicum]|uniref:hypothetical protein n=1 Tax=Bradyrhizobium cosmicum TaxID=1404864 RepID=UPI0028EC9BD2|nr:hypothetical protein [Bradyrhizobium cosmicum]